MFIKILVVREKVTKKEWNKSMPNPLKHKQKVFVVKDQDNVPEGFVRVKHGKSVSIFDINHFEEYVSKKSKNR